MPYKDPIIAKEYRDKHYRKYRKLYIQRAKERRLRLQGTKTWKEYYREYGRKPERKKYKQKWWLEIPRWEKLYIYMKRRVKTHKEYKDVKVLLTLNELKRVWDRDKADTFIKPCVHRKRKGNYTKNNIKVMEFKDHVKLHLKRRYL